ncbi:MAG: metallophosphoesterase [Clostridia bacterium]|nr:metallophosphoesterase [Clostridia bacterium]
MVYVVSDIHGYPLEKFKEHLSSTGFSDDDFLYVLGDVIDRGTDGIKILRWLAELPNAELILGNHEAMMLSCSFLFEEITDDSVSMLNDDSIGAFSDWMLNGGEQTLSALKDLSNEERSDILHYLCDAPLYEAITVNDRDFLLTHSGLGSFDKNKKLSAYKEHDFLRTRPTTDTVYFDDIITVFGHTPTFVYGEQYRGKALKTKTWINIDAGAAAGHPPMILRLDDMKEFYFE